MFAVPGWSVSAEKLKTQTQPLPEKAGAEGASKSKKRKRAGKDKGLQVTDENVGQLWQQQFEDGPKPADGLSGVNAIKVGERKEKKQKVDAPIAKEEDVNAAPAAAAAAAAASTPKKEKKQKAEKAKKETVEDSAKTQEVEKTQQVQQAQAPPAVDGPPKDKKKKDKKNKQEQQHKEIAPSTIATPSDKKAATAAAASAPPPVPAIAATAKLTPMQSAMRQKLISARFRHLNQTLYTAPSATSLALFATNPEMFEDYHSGFRQQVAVWPSNPVDTFIATIRERGAARPAGHKDKRAKKNPNLIDAEAAKTGAQPLPRTGGKCTIADLGCGDGKLAATLTADKTTRNQNLKIMSYDLQSPAKHVTKADVANLPLGDGEVDVAIFCLALMGTNWIDFIEEAYRVLHWKGELWVAEIKSRFGRVGGDKGKGRVVEHSVGSKRKAAAGKKAADDAKKVAKEQEEDALLKTEVDGVETGKEETDVSGFVEVLRRRGFVLKDENSVDLGNKMFVRMEFIKAAAPVVGKNVREEQPKRGGEEGVTWKAKPKAKFVEKEVKEVSVEDEAKVLKPCLYKIR